MNTRTTSMARRNLHTCFFLTTLFLASCAATVPPQRGSSPAIDDRLYFGRSIAGGALVSDADWDAFVARVIVPHFPDGHTAWHAEGAWRNSSGAVIREQSFVVEVIHPDDHVSDTAVEQIVDAYKRQFHQESVLWVRAAAYARF